jgi:YggT family protein
MAAVGSILHFLLLIFILLLIARFIVDWVQVFARQWTPHGPALVVLEAVYSTTDPPIKAVRRILPPIRLGGMALDLSPMVVLIICYLLLSLVGAIFLA